MVGETQVKAALSTVYDPEIGLDIITLGLVYDIAIAETGKVDIVMTMTTPGCPMREVIVSGVTHAVGALSGVSEVVVDVVWDPAWSPERIDDAGRKMLGMRS